MAALSAKSLRVDMRVAKCRSFAKRSKKKRGYWSILQNGACVHHVMVSKINGSHFGLPPSEIHKMTGVGGKMTYLHRPHFVLLSHSRSAQNTFLVFRSLLLWISGLQQPLPDPVVCVDSCPSTNNTSGETFSTFQPAHQVKQVQRFSFDYLGTFRDQQPGKRRYQPTTRRNPSALTSHPSCRGRWAEETGNFKVLCRNFRPMLIPFITVFFREFIWKSSGIHVRLLATVSLPLSLSLAHRSETLMMNNSERTLNVLSELVIMSVFDTACTVSCTAKP